MVPAILLTTHPHDNIRTKLRQSTFFPNLFVTTLWSNFQLVPAIKIKEYKKKISKTKTIYFDIKRIINIKGNNDKKERI